METLRAPARDLRGSQDNKLLLKDCLLIQVGMVDRTADESAFELVFEHLFNQLA